MKSYLTSLTTLSLALMALMSYSFTTAQWTNPPENPPDGNVAAPLNVGPDPQVKQGNIGANVLFSNALVAATTTWSPQYCDGFGNNCYDPAIVKELEYLLTEQVAFHVKDGYRNSNTMGKISTFESPSQNFGEGWKSDNTFQPSIGGWYYIFANGFATHCSDDQSARLQILKNGAEVLSLVRGRSTGTTSDIPLSVGAVTFLNGANDYIEFQSQESCSGGTSNKVEGVSAGGFMIFSKYLP